MNAAAVRWSCPADGSSSTSVAGRRASAIARARRFCWPNDIASGGRVRMSSRPSRDVRRRQSSTRASNSAGSRPRFRGPNSSSSSTVFEKSIWLGLWNTYPNSVASSAVGPFGDRRPVDEDAAVGDLQEPHRRTEQRRLAGAVRAEDGHDLVRRRASRRRHGGSRGHRWMPVRLGTRGAARSPSRAGLTRSRASRPARPRPASPEPTACARGRRRTGA